MYNNKKLSCLRVNDSGNSPWKNQKKFPSNRRDEIRSDYEKQKAFEKGKKMMKQKNY